MNTDFRIVTIVFSAFGAVAGIVFVTAQYYFARAQLRHRLPGGVAVRADSAPSSDGGLSAFVARHFAEERYGVDSKLRQKLRRELIRAGFFGGSAIQYYVFARFCSVVVLPLLVFGVISFFAPSTPLYLETLAAAIAAATGVALPDAYLSSRQRNLQTEYRLIFPDLLDLLVVCVGAGLSVEASFERLRGQMGKRCRALAMNLELMGAEMRAGRSSVEALQSFADRLNLDEASSFVAVLRHSIELGGDVAASLRVFSDEMREKRMLRAETRANELPVKMVLPLALGIFPVILLIVMLPVILKLMKVFAQV
jgi:tight adherence protein C